MHCKNYRAYTMAEAMAAVKADLGADAIVLHTRTLQQGGFLGLGRRTVIEVTAARADQLPAQSAPERSEQHLGANRESPRAYGNGRSQRSLDERADERTRMAVDDNAPATQFDRDRTRLLAQAMAVKLEREQALTPRVSAGTAAAANAAATSAAAAQALQASHASRQQPAPGDAGESLRAREITQGTPKNGSHGASAGASSPSSSSVSPNSVRPSSGSPSSGSPSPLSPTSVATGSQTTNPHAAAHGGQLSVNQPPSTGVAQRYVLIPANAGATSAAAALAQRAVDRSLIAQRVLTPAEAPTERPVHPPVQSVSPAARAKTAISVAPSPTGRQESRLAALAAPDTSDIDLAARSVAHDPVSPVEEVTQIESVRPPKDGASDWSSDRAGDGVRQGPRGFAHRVTLTDPLHVREERDDLQRATIVERVRQPQARPAAPRGEPTQRFDMDEIGALVEQVLRRSAATPSAPNPSSAPQASVPAPAARPARLESLYAHLLSQDLGNELADALVRELQASLSAEEMASDHAVRSAALERIAALLPNGGGIEPVNGRWRRDNRPLTIAFVGPTGVGKTTTVAKIAASLKLRYGARLGLITCDTYRIAAVDQLRTYADIIGVPLEIVMSEAEMQEARQRLADVDVVLIDTAGRSQHDVDRLGELRTLMRAAEPHETHLVLSSVASERVLLREADAFSSIGVQRIVLTKLDEAVGLGAVLRVLRQVGRGVSYLTTGQEVPQHLEAARGGRLAEFVLAGAPVV